MVLTAPQALNLWRAALVESLRRGGERQRVGHQHHPAGGEGVVGEASVVAVGAAGAEEALVGEVVEVVDEHLAAFIAARNTAPGGTLPLNTNGGGLSYMHSGMYGMYALQESVRQMRGIAPAQASADLTARRALVTGAGGFVGRWLCRELLDADPHPTGRVAGATDLCVGSLCYEHHENTNGC